MRGTLTTFSCALLLAATSQAGAEVRLPSFLDNLLDSLGPEDGRQGRSMTRGECGTYVMVSSINVFVTDRCWGTETTRTWA